MRSILLIVWDMVVIFICSALLVPLNVLKWLHKQPTVIIALIVIIVVLLQIVIEILIRH